MVGFQPTIKPSSVAKIKIAGADACPLLTLNSLLVPRVMFHTTPVRDPRVDPGAGGISTTSGFWGVGKSWPRPLYSVERPVPLSLIQNGLVPSCTRPHPLTRCGLVFAATPG